MVFFMKIPACHVYMGSREHIDVVCEREHIDVGTFAQKCGIASALRNAIVECAMDPYGEEAF